jgi:hypothetical protein
MPAARPPARRPIRQALSVATAMVALVGVAAQASAIDRITQGTGLNGEVSTLTTQPDANGVRYVGGGFTAYKAWNTGIAAVVSTATGDVDPSFPRFGGWPYVQKVIADGSGGFYISGVQDIGGTSVSNLGHVLADGSLDPNFRPTITGGSVETLAISGTTLLVGGGFTSVNGTPRSRLAALSPTGALLSWNPGVTGAVRSIDVDSATSTAYLGGSFSTVGGQTRGNAAAVPIGDRPANAGTCLANYDAVDCAPTAFDPDVSGYAVFDLAVDRANSAVYLAGEFSSVGGSAQSRLAAVNASTGARDASWSPDPDAQVMTVTVNGSRVYVGGYFGTIAGQTRGWVASFATTGGRAIDAWNPNAAMGGTCQCGDGVRDIQVVGSTTYLAGNFWSLGGVARNRVGAVDTTTGIATAWNPHVGDATNGSPSTVWSIAVAGAKTMIGGNFDNVGGMARDHVAAIGPDGVLTSWAPAVNSSVTSFATLGDSVYMVGGFTSIDGQPRRGAGAVTTAGTLTGWNPQPSGGNPLKVVAAGDTVYLGGGFTGMGGQPRVAVASVDPTTGTLNGGFDAAIDGSIDSMAVLDNRLYLGGRFITIAGNAPPSSLVAVSASTGALDAGWNAGPLGPCTLVFSLATFGNRLFAGGCFGTVTQGGTQHTREYVAAFDTSTGALDQNWDAHLTGGGNMYGGVVAIAPTVRGIYLGGQGAQVDPAGAEARSGITMVDTGTGALLPWRADAAGGDAAIRGISASDAAVYVGGFFGTIGGETRQDSAAIGTDGTVLAPWPMDPATTRTLSVQMDGTGVVASNPGGINCGDTCRYAYAIGRTVTLSADTTGSAFTKWSGACTGTATTCTVTVNAATSVVAHFADGTGTGGSGGDGSGTGPGAASNPSSNACAASPSIATLTKRPRFASAHGRTTLSGLGLTLNAAGRYTLIIQTESGARVSLVKGATVARRTLRKTFYAPVTRAKGPNAITMRAVLRRASAKGLMLRVIVRNACGTLQAQEIPLS